MPHKHKSSGKGDRPAALSLERFANAKVSKYDKRKVLQKQREVAARNISKLKQLKKRLEAQGKFHSILPQLDVDELDAAAPAVEEERAAKRPRVRPASVDAPATKTAPPGSTAAATATGRQRARVAQRRHDLGPEDAPAASGAPAGEVQRPAKPSKRPKPPSQLQRVAADRQAAASQLELEQEERRRAREEVLQFKAAKQKERQAQKHRFFQRTKRGQPVMKHRIEKLLQDLQGQQGG